MAKFLTTQGTAYELEEIIIHATKWLILISPYLNISENFLQRLQDADKRKVKIIIVYGKDVLKLEEKRKLQELENLSLYYFKNLHAKCFLNEATMIITSMNMYEFSEKTNREMGVLIRKDNESDQEVYEGAMREVKSIIDSSKEDSVLTQPKLRSMNKVRTASVELSQPTSAKGGSLAKVGEALVGFLNAISEKDDAISKLREGYCIRCGKNIPYNSDKPYCRQCFSSWRGWENPTYVEKYCHSCGKKDRSSMLYPLCRSCF